LRTYESLDFGIRSIRFVNRKIKNHDLIYASPWAFLGQLMIILLRTNRKAPLIMNVQDLYPESLFTKIRPKAICTFIKPLCLIDKYIAKHSTHLTVVSESLKQVYVKERKIDGTK